MWQSAEVMQTFKACSQNECRCTQYDTINRFKTTHLMFFTQVELHTLAYSVDMCGWMSASLHIETQLGEDSLHPAENRKQKTYIYIYIYGCVIPAPKYINNCWCMVVCMCCFVCVHLSGSIHQHDTMTDRTRMLHSVSGFTPYVSGICDQQMPKYPYICI